MRAWIVLVTAVIILLVALLVAQSQVTTSNDPQYPPIPVQVNSTTIIHERQAQWSLTHYGPYPWAWEMQ